MAHVSPELIEKAKTAKTAEELLALAKENGVDLTAEEAKVYSAQLIPATGELDDDALDDVSGGGCGGGSDSSNSSTVDSKFVTKVCCGCYQTVQFEKLQDPDGDIDGFFGKCPSCGRINFNL